MTGTENETEYVPIVVSRNVDAPSLEMSPDPSCGPSFGKLTAEPTATVATLSGGISA
ncbi:MAG TPA: hypothetical protein VHW26_05825 [Solirubrobacteraceae bacterium]|nr:hypothetical protein [Solirubrobacteraceae bacterium]